jgi:serine/threonine-protein kinase
MPIPLKTGVVLRDRYRLQERIGQGGMGNIYQADDMRLEGRKCALKEVEHDRNLPEKVLREARDQFLREATVLARLDHPNLPKVSDFFSIGEKDYLVMDFVPGKDLRTLILEAKAHNVFLNERDVLDWVSQLADALTYLHRQSPPIVHRDIKPSNLKITPDGLLKLVDFGLVKVLAPDEETITIIQGQGTLLYTPLEQYGGSEIHTDVRSDIYAFGATLYQLLTCQAPVDARQRFLHPESQVPPRKINPSLSIRTEKAILWAMELHPDQRPDSIETFRQYLFGTKELPQRPMSRPSRVRTLDALLAPPESILFGISAILLLLSLITTFGR